MARYEHGEGEATMFWEYEVKGTSYTARWGKVGDRKVHSKQFDFETAGLTWRAVIDACQEVMARGYQLIGADGKRVPPPEPEVETPEPAGPRPYIRRYFLRSYPKPTPMFEVQLDGNSYVERSWTLSDDAKVDEKRHEFRTAVEAHDAADAAIAARVAQRWEHDTTQGEPPKRKRPKPPKRKPIGVRAEAALVESPEDPKVWQVYADAMLQDGEAWGEVIVAACSRKKAPAAQAAATAQILGASAGTGCSLTWKYGTVEELVLVPQDESDESPLPALERALAHPAGRLMRRLILGLSPDAGGDWSFDEHLALLANGPVLPLLHTLDLSREASFMDQPSFRRVGDLRPLWKIAPRLRELRLFGGPGTEDEQPVVLGSIVAPHLETLVFKSGGLHRSVARDLGKASLPRLSRLELWFGQEAYGNTHTLKDLAGILGGAKLPALVSLGLKNSEWRADLIELVATSALLPRLSDLDLGDGTLGEESVPVLLAHAKRFAHLSRLSLANNYFARNHQATLKRAIPGLALGTQREDDGDHRYTEIGE